MTWRKEEMGKKHPICMINHELDQTNLYFLFSFLSFNLKSFMFQYNNNAIGY